MYYIATQQRGINAWTVGTIILLLAEASLAPAAQTLSVAEAIQLSQRTGRPIFAVAGASYCPACVKLLKTLNTDESLQPLIAQFVPLKINAQSSDYDRWKQFFPPERSAIPALFVVTPQGKQLYARIGGLPSKNLQQMLLNCLEKAGRYPTAEQWQQIETDLQTTQTALKEGRTADAMELLQPIQAGLVKLGSLADLTKSGQQVNASVRQLATQQQQQLQQALQAFVSRSDLESALQVARIEQLCQLFPQLSKQAAAEIKKRLASSSHRKLIRQAREYQQALMLVNDAKSRRKGQRLLERITKRYPQSELAKLANRKLQELGVSVSGNAESESQHSLRSWTDNSGRFSIQARLLEIQGDRVRLQKTDGEVLTIAIEKLDAAAQQYLAEHRAEQQ